MASSFAPRAISLQQHLQALLNDFEAVSWHEEVSSTNTLLMQGLRENPQLACPRLLGANLQHQGRGRQGRRWQGIPGLALMFSCALRVQCRRDHVAPLAPLFGMAAAEVLRSKLPAPAQADLQLKWPNDILFQGAKLSGLLVESLSLPDSPDTQLVVAGIGVNLGHGHSLGQMLGRRIADLYTISGHHPQGSEQAALIMCDLAADIARAWLQLISQYAAGGFAHFLRRFEALDALRGKDVTVFNHDGSQFSGRAMGLDEQARLIVEGPAGPQAVLSAEVSVRTQGEPPPET